MIILAEITPYDPAQSAQVTVRFSSGAVTPIYNGLHWPARLADGFSLGMAIFEDGFETPGSTRTAGSLQILIGDGGADALTTYNWDQRQVKIWTGEGSDFANFTLRFNGFVSAVSYNENSLDLTLGDKSNIFDKPVDFPTYLGTGGPEGPAEMTGVVKPFCFGPVFNMEPTLVDATNLIYQVHNRAVQAIDNVFDQAVQLTSDGDATDLSAWTAIPGKYKTDLSKGLFKLGAKPAGLITADVRGDAQGGYVATAGDILQRLLDFMPDSGSVTVDGAAFTALNIANSAEVSIHGRASLTGRDIFNVLMRSIGGFWLVDWLGNLTVGIHDLATPAGSLTDRHIAGLSRLDSPAPVWRLKTTYRPTYRLQGGNEIAAADLGGGMRSGAGVPAANLGIIGDLYINSNDGKLYKKTAVNVWTFQYDTTGPGGDTWLDGAGVPAGSLGSVGDYYLNSANGDYYKKTGAAAWTKQGNIAGPQGNTGATGSPGATGAQGPQGVQGPAGADGTPRYIWIAYADSADGVTNFTNGAPGARKYIGLAHNKTSATESANPADYTWNLVEGPQGPQGNTGAAGSTGAQGPQGIPGAPGADGTPRYIWIAYADSADGVTNFTNGAPGARKYIGLAHNKTSATESTNPADYTWNLVEGPQGPQGNTGAAGSTGAQGPQGVAGPAGADGTPRYIWIAYADSADGVTNFTNGAPGARKYIGIAHNKTSATESTNPADYTWSKIEGPSGGTGATGATGADGDEIRLAFVSSVSQPATPTGSTFPPTGWTEAPPGGAASIWVTTVKFTAGGTFVGPWTTPTQFANPGTTARSGVASIGVPVFITNTTSAALGSVITLDLGPNGSHTVNYTLNFKSADTGPSTLYAKMQWRPVGGTWADLTTEKSSTSGNNFEPAILADSLVTAFSGSQAAYEFRLMVRKSGSSANLTGASAKASWTNA